jgi:adenylate cyclase
MCSGLPTMPGTATSDPSKTPPDPRKLVAIVYADMMGYSRLIGIDDQGTLQRLKKLRSDLIDPFIRKHSGRIVQTGGDSLLIVFDSIDGAVRCAVKIQQQVPVHDGDQPVDRAIRFRMGIGLGDAIVDGTDLHGDTVNIAARLQAECPPGGICVTRSVRDFMQDRLDLAFEPLGALDLKNIARPVDAFLLRPDAAATPTNGRTVVPIHGHPLPLPEKPSIAVLPFANLGTDISQEYFSEAVADDIITELSRSRSLFVIARNSSFTYKGKSVSVKQIARELGVRYVVEGSLRCDKHRVRINARLVDAIFGNHIWADRYDRKLEDIFAVQDEITIAIATAVLPAISDAELRRIRRKPPESLGAWEAYQRGIWHMGRIGLAENEAAEGFLKRAIELDPDFVAAHAALVTAISYSFSLYRTRTLAEAIGATRQIAQRAIFLDPSDAFAHTSMSDYYFLSGDCTGAVAEARRALSISPNVADCHCVLGLTLIYSGQPREGLKALREGMRLDPRDPLRYMRMLYVAAAYYFLGEYGSSVEAVNEAIGLYPNHPSVSRLRAAALGQAGRLSEAEEALRTAIAGDPKMLEILPSYDLYVRHYSPWLRREDHEHLLDGLRKAGWHG